MARPPGPSNPLPDRPPAPLPAGPETRLPPLTPPPLIGTGVTLSPEGTSGEGVSVKSDDSVVTFRMHPDELEKLRAVATQLGITLTEFVARALADSLFLQQQLDAGSVVLLRNSAGELHKLELR